MEDVLGVSLDSKDGFESVEEMLHEGLRRAQDKAEAQQHARQAERKPGKRQQKAEQAQQEAQTTLLRMEFELPWGTVISAAGLSRHLNVLECTYQSGIKAMQNDLERIEDDQVFKQWLKEQHKTMNEPDLMDLLDLGIFDGPVSGRR